MSASPQQSVSDESCYVLAAHGPSPEIVSGHLHLGGEDPDGHRISVTNYYLELDDRPWLPVMGEFHYSRFPHQEWDRSLGTIKAGGIDVVATYVFWIHHEEDEGRFCWTGDRDLRAFAQLCARHGLRLLVRIGPFAHGECRNGGLPDWLYGRPFAVRSLDRRFLAYVARLYGEIAVQLKGLLYAEGGPVIGVQLDNEYMHSGAPWEVTYRQGMQWVPEGSDGEAYMQALKGLAIEAGLRVPLYTCTGWTGSPVPAHEFLPMHGGYAYQPWVDSFAVEHPPTREFLFRNRHRQPIAAPGSPTYEPTDYPYACCELGGGMQAYYNVRPVVPPYIPQAMAVVALGSGSAMIGYYMYHGGSQPVGDHGFMNEYRCPRISYDYQAPIGEYGQITPAYQWLKLLHLFIQAFGEQLAPMAVAIPEHAVDDPWDTATPRYAARLKDGSGFLFINNAQDHVEMRDLHDVRFSLELDAASLCIPQRRGLSLDRNCCAIVPFNMALGDVTLIYATAQPLTTLFTGAINEYFFFTPPGMSAEYAFDASTVAELTLASGEQFDDGARICARPVPGLAGTITVRSAQGTTIRVHTLTHAQALSCWKLPLWGEDHIVLSGAALLPCDDGLELSFMNQTSAALWIYPAASAALEVNHGELTVVRDGPYSCCTVTVPDVASPYDVVRVAKDCAAVHALDAPSPHVREVFLQIEYSGDLGEAHLAGRLVADNFANGTPWSIGLRRFAAALTDEDLMVTVLPRREEAPTHFVSTGMTVRPEPSGVAPAHIDSIAVVPEYVVRLIADSSKCLSRP